MQTRGCGGTKANSDLPNSAGTKAPGLSRLAEVQSSDIQWLECGRNIVSQLSVPQWDTGREQKMKFSAAYKAHVADVDAGVSNCGSGFPRVVAIRRFRCHLQRSSQNEVLP